MKTEEESLFAAASIYDSKSNHDGDPGLLKARSSVSHSPSVVLEDPIVTSLFRHYVDV